MAWVRLSRDSRDSLSTQTSKNQALQISIDETRTLIYTSRSPFNRNCHNMRTVSVYWLTVQPHQLGRLFVEVLAGLALKRLKKTLVFSGYYGSTGCILFVVILVQKLLWSYRNGNMQYFDSYFFFNAVNKIRLKINHYFFCKINVTWPKASDIYIYIYIYIILVYHIW